METHLNKNVLNLRLYHKYSKNNGRLQLVITIFFYKTHPPEGLIHTLLSRLPTVI